MRPATPRLAPPRLLRRRLAAPRLSTPAFALLALAAVCLLHGAYVLDASFHNDSWGMYLTASRDLPLGELLDLYGWMSFRPVGRVYWPMTFEILGLDPSAHLAWTVAISVGLVVALFALLRELRLPAWLAGVAALLCLVVPAGDATRLWAGASSNSLSIALWLTGTVLALRALQHHGRRAIALHVAAAVVLLTSLLLYEVAALAMIASAALYLLRAPLRPALARGALDAALAIGALLWTSSRSIYSSASPGETIDRIRPFYGQAARVFADTVFPFASVRTVVAVALVGLLTIAAAIVLVRAGDREPLRRWGVLGGLGLAIMLAGWTILLPSPFWPLGTGAANRINAFAGVGMVLFVVALVGALGAAGATLAGRRPAWGSTVAMAILLPVLAIGWTVDLKAHSGDWRQAGDEQRRVLTAIRAALPPPDRATTVFSFGHAIESVPGISIMAAPWEVQGALRSVYPDGRVTGYPALPGTTIDCGRDGLQAHNNNDQFATQAARYGEVVFVDVPSRRSERIGDAAACRRAAASFVPGPQFLPGD